MQKEEMFRQLFRRERESNRIGEFYFMNSKLLEKLGLLTFALVFWLSLGAAGTLHAQESTFDWQATNDESARLDPADYYTGRVFKFGDQAGNVHLDIEAQDQVTVEMAPSEQWSEAMRHPELLARVSFRCIREHVTKATYLCNIAPGRPMTLVFRDERDADRTMVTGLGQGSTEHGTVRQFLSPNDIHIQYYRWACVENCNAPKYQWVAELKETYDLNSTLKVYDGIAAERDGEPFSVKVSSPVPVTVAIVPSRAAAELRAKPDSLDSALDGRTCMERSVRSAAFECTFDVADGPQSLVAVVMAAEGGKAPANKKAEVEVVASKCVANCLTDPEK
jgi:hypothetical protein